MVASFDRGHTEIECLIVNAVHNAGARVKQIDLQGMVQDGRIKLIASLRLVTAQGDECKVQLQHEQIEQLIDDSLESQGYKTTALERVYFGNPDGSRPDWFQPVGCKFWVNLAAKPARRKRGVLPPGEPAELPGLMGIDVSHWQGRPDWARLREAGVEYAFIKASEGGDFVDEEFAANFRRANENGVLRGAYHFFRPKTSVERQLDNFLRVMGPLSPGALPPVLDVEDPRLWRGISKRKAANLCVDFLEGLRQRLGANIKPIIYMSTSFSLGVLGEDERLSQYTLWVADYSSPSFPRQPRVPQPWATWNFWQYTEKGRVPGITGDVDINRFNGDRAALEALLVR
jgi:GH25 family lysozyme M1 (1,4-beta-N-acetylmuramidase)